MILSILLDICVGSIMIAGTGYALVWAFTQIKKMLNKDKGINLSKDSATRNIWE